MTERKVTVRVHVRPAGEAAFLAPGAVFNRKTRTWELIAASRAEADALADAYDGEIVDDDNDEDEASS